MNKPFILLCEDKRHGEYETYEAANKAGMASGKRWYEIIDLSKLRKPTD